MVNRKSLKLTILLCSLLISSWVASCLFFSGSSVCSFSYFLDFLAPIKGARRPEKGPGAISQKKVTRFPPRPGQITAFFWRFLAAYCARGQSSNAVAQGWQLLRTWTVRIQTNQQANNMLMMTHTGHWKKGNKKDQDH